MQPPIPNHTFFQVLAHCAVCSQQVELLKFNAISTCGSPSFLLLKKTFLGKWKKQGVFITQDTNYYCVVVPESLYRKKLYFCFIVVFVFVEQSNIHSNITPSFPNFAPNSEKVVYGNGQIVFDSKKLDSEALKIVGFGSDSRQIFGYPLIYYKL